jgi:hypothetical protein
MKITLQSPPFISKSLTRGRPGSDFDLNYMEGTDSFHYKYKKIKFKPSLELDKTYKKLTSLYPKIKSLYDEFIALTETFDDLLETEEENKSKTNIPKGKILASFIRDKSIFAEFGFKTPNPKFKKFTLSELTKIEQKLKLKYKPVVVLSYGLSKKPYKINSYYGIDVNRSMGSIGISLMYLNPENESLIFDKNEY